MLKPVVGAIALAIACPSFSGVNAGQSLFYPSLQLTHENTEFSYQERLEIHKARQKASKDLNAMKASLASLVAIPTAKHRGLAQKDNPKINKFGKQVQKLAQSFGLEFINHKNLFFEIVLRGQNRLSPIGLYTHGDVVPANVTEWETPDGKPLSPYKLTEIGDRLYGRGVQDDKGPIVSALFALKHLKERKQPLARDIHLIITTDEETTGEGIAYFKSLGHIPNINIGLDSSYPIVIAEDGTGSMHLSVGANSQDNTLKPSDIEIVGIEGSRSNNTIPRQATAVLKVKRSPDKVISKIHHQIKQYVKANGNNFVMKANGCGLSLICLQVIGHSAHASQPEAGINPVSRVVGYLHSMQKQLSIKPSPILNAVNMNQALFGLDYYGKKLGINYQSKLMGPLVLSLTEAYQDKDRFVLGYNLRVPEGKMPQELKQRIEKKLSQYQMKTNIDLKNEIRIGQPVKRDPNQPLIKKLQNVYQLVEGKPAQLIGIRGYTEVHELPNGISFGPNYHGQTYQGHQASEYIKKDSLVHNQVMFYTALVKLQSKL